MRRVTKEDINSARKSGIWDLGNRVLYELCRTHPDHSSHDVIVAKVWLIGRSYAASIERRRKPRESGDDFYEDIVAPAIKRSEIDSWIASIRRTDKPGSGKTIEAHKNLVDLFRSISGLEKRSLASKYLHFHKPSAFFIYDSRSKRAITKVVPKIEQIPDIITNCHDLEYKDFVRRCIWLRNYIETSMGEELTPRELDKLLLAIANNVL